MIRLIYVFFVGLFVAIFLGTGIAVFYPPPPAPSQPGWYGMIEKSQLSEAERNRVEQFDQQQKTYLSRLSVYNRNVSMITLGFAILILVVSLTLNRQLGVVADGLLLGGIFSLLYGIGRGMATDDNKYRFIVAATGLAITIILGYVKFKPTAEHTIAKAHSR